MVTLSFHRLIMGKVEISYFLKTITIKISKFCGPRTWLGGLSLEVGTEAQENN